MSRLPLLVETKLAELTLEQKSIFHKEYERRKKSVLIGYLLLIPLGWHYAYVKKWGSQILCIITLWGLLIWWLVDWFRLPSIIKRYNDDLAVKIMVEYAALFPVKDKKELGESSNSFTKWKELNPDRSINEFYKTNR